jgi:hypothetical protein
MVRPCEYVSDLLGETHEFFVTEEVSARVVQDDAREVFVGSFDEERNQDGDDVCFSLGEHESGTLRDAVSDRLLPRQSFLNPSLHLFLVHGWFYSVVRGSEEVCQEVKRVQRRGRHVEGADRQYRLALRIHDLNIFRQRTEFRAGCQEFEAPRARVHGEPSARDHTDSHGDPGSRKPRTDRAVSAQKVHEPTFYPWLV